MKRIGLDPSHRLIWKLLNEHLQNVLMTEHAHTERGLLLHSTSLWRCPSVVQGSLQALGGMKVTPPAFLLRASSVCLGRQWVGQGDENDGDPHSNSCLGSSSAEAPFQEPLARVSEHWVLGALCCLSRHLAPSQVPSNPQDGEGFLNHYRCWESRRDDSLGCILDL